LSLAVFCKVLYIARPAQPDGGNQMKRILWLLPLTILASPAAANLISVGLQYDASAISTVGSGDNRVLLPGLLFEGFTLGLTVTTGDGCLMRCTRDARFLDSTASISSGDAGSLRIFVTEQDLGGELGEPRLLNGFTVDGLTAGSVEYRTLIDGANGLYVGTTIAAASFTDNGINRSPIPVEEPIPAPYSLTEEITFSSTGAGGVFGSVTLNYWDRSVPEPNIGVWLLGAALAAFVIKRALDLRLPKRPHYDD
jgi:hypothetical protein